MQDRLLKKSDLGSFLKKISKGYEIIAPVKKDILRFSAIKGEEEISLVGTPLFTAKKYFYPQRKDVFSYKNEKIMESYSNKKYLLFGMRLCDINAMQRLDKLFLDDTHFKKARENNIIIGLNCETAPEETCFCQSMGLNDSGYDLFFCDAWDYFHIKVGSKKGEMLVKGLKTSDFTPRPIKTKKSLQKKDLSKLFSNPSWKELSKKCISCGACTQLCPDCLCFDIQDHPNLDLKSGKRTLEWDSCQYRDFTKVAGGHVFRDSRENRLKHRVYHKLQYFREKFGEDMCTGCGRCIRGCPTKIDFVKAINEMREDE